MDQLQDTVFLTGLRTVWGVSKAELTPYGNLTESEQKNLQALIENGDLTETKTALILTEAGRLKADGIAASFFRI